MSNKNLIEQLGKIQFTEEDLLCLKKYLPLNYINLIVSKLNNQVSVRTIKYVLSGKHKDHNNIIETALDIAFEEKKKREAIAKRLSKLK